jgi:hypothetical protein
MLNLAFHVLGRCYKTTMKDCEQVHICRDFDSLKSLFVSFFSCEIIILLLVSLKKVSLCPESI